MGNIKFLFLATFSFILCCCKKDEIKLNQLVDSTVEVYKNELPDKIVFYRDKNNSFINDNSKYIFLDGKSLINKNDENFMLLHIGSDKENKNVNILSFKTGKQYVCIFNDTGKLISKNIIQWKLGESKPYYIYYEILKRKYPNYMNWDLFPIPQDSLK